MIAGSSQGGRNGARRRRWSSVRLGTVAAAAFAATPSFAQIADPYHGPGSSGSIDVAERPHPEFAPIGGRLGSFFLLPTVDAALQLDDNILGTDRDRQRDLIASARVGAALESRWSRHALEVDGYGRTVRYADHRSQDADAFGGHALGRYDLGHDARVQLDLSYDDQPEDRLDANASAESLRPIHYRQFAAIGRYDRRLGPLAATLRLQHLALDFNDGRTAAGATVDQRFRDVVQDVVTAIVRHDTAGGGAIILAGQHDVLRYPRDGSLDRNSAGYRVEVGAGLQLTSLVQAEVRLGYLTRRNDNPLLRNAGGLSLYANAVWTPTPRVSIRLVANRDVEPAGSISASGNLRAQATLSATYEVLRNLLVTPSARYARIDLIGLPGGNDEAEARLDGVFHLSRRYRLTGQVRHVGRSAGQYRAVSATTALVGFGVTL